MSTRRRKAIVVLASLAVALILSELWLRVRGYSSPNFFRPDSRLGWSLRPGAEGIFREEGGSFVRINSEGWRERESSGAEPSDALRIAVLGDSFVLALQVPPEQGFVARLGEELSRCAGAQGRRVETLNFGVGGYGTAQELLVLRERVWSHAPDWVLLAFYPGNDLHDNHRALDSNRFRPYFQLDSEGERAALVLDDSFRDSLGFRWRDLPLTRFLSDRLANLRLVQLGRQAKRGVQKWSRSAAAPKSGDAPVSERAELADAGFDLRTGPDWNAAWRVTEAMLLAMRNEVQAHGARFAIVSVTSGIQVHPDPQQRADFARALGLDNLLFAEERLQAFGRAAEVPILTLAHPLQELAQKDGVYFHGFANSGLGSGHWNETGHAAAARLIAAWLCPELAQRPTASSPGASGD